MAGFAKKVATLAAAAALILATSTLTAPEGGFKSSRKEEISHVG
jgi:hypothetical protein